jgi:CheY-like chemotaxis protein
LSSLHALIIDDNIKNLNVLSRLLSKEGVVSTKVQDPCLLDSVLQDITDVRVIFLDLELPGLDGYQILDKLKADARFQAVPVVAYTVHLGEIMTAYDRGFQGFLGKPLDVDKFPHQLNRILHGEPVWEVS